MAKKMTFDEYLLTLDGVWCIVLITELTSAVDSDDRRFAYGGIVEAHKDFIIIHGDDGVPRAVPIENILSVEIAGEEDEDDDDDSSKQLDLFAEFEKRYKEYKENP